MGSTLQKTTKPRETITDQLWSILPKVLPDAPTDALNGTELIARLREEGFEGSTENSLRQYFSNFSTDPASPIAKVAKGHGYFKRKTDPLTLNETLAEQAEGESPEDGRGRDAQLEEKFRALFMKWSENQDQFPVLLNHNEGAKRIAGLNKWKYPDVVSVRWDVLDQESRDVFDENSLDVMQGLGEQPFRLISTELKVDLKPSSLRQSFFQCVSNSKWAHISQLVIAGAISDENIVAELERLGPSYGVSVLSFGLTQERLQNLPSADKIRSMSNAADVDDLLQGITVTVIATGAEKEQLDWGQLRDLQKQLDSVNQVLEWIARCLKDKQPHSFDAWSKNLKKKSRR